MNGSNTPILNQGSRGSIFVGWSYLHFQWFLKVEGGEKKKGLRNTFLNAFKCEETCLVSLHPEIWRVKPWLSSYIISSIM